MHKLVSSDRFYFEERRNSIRIRPDFFFMERLSAVYQCVEFL